MTRKAERPDLARRTTRREEQRAMVQQQAEVPAPERQPDFMWGGQPVYQCRLGCGDRYQRIADLPAVEAHERAEHPTNLRATGLLDANGKPVIVRVD